MMLKNSNAKFAFLYMFSLVALLFVALGTGQVFFHAINKYVSDALSPFSSPFMQLTTAISYLIISIPIYFSLVYIIEKSLKNKDLDKDAGIRRWLVYFILLVSSIVMVIWLIVTLNNYLNGELALRSGLKALTAFLISAIIFSYYFYDVRRDKIVAADPVIRSYFIGGLIITIGALIFSFFFVESPAEARQRKHDAEVLNQFSQIDSAINAYYSKNNRLPESIVQSFEESPYLDINNFKDPLSAKAYDYKKVGDDAYELCAEFMTDNRNQNNQRDYNYSDRWPHAAGYQCLKQKALDYEQGGATKAAPVR